MNHDYTHCMDCSEDNCPKDCFRYKLVKDLNNVDPNLVLTWSHLLGIWDCRLVKCWDCIYSSRLNDGFVLCRRTKTPIGTDKDNTCKYGKRW